MKYTNIKARSKYTFYNQEGDTIWIIKTFRRHTDNKLYVSIYFPKTGYRTDVPYEDVRNKTVKDRRKPSILGIGYLGDDYDKLKISQPVLLKALYMRWKLMIYRCYKPDHKSHKSYFDKSVTVCERWHNFSTFFYDAQILPGYNDKLLLENKISLDKDCKQVGEESNKQYSPYTCVWLTYKEQQKYVDHYSPQKKVWLYVTHPDGRETLEEGLGRISRKYGIDMKCINRCLNGIQKESKGYKFRRYEAE